MLNESKKILAFGILFATSFLSLAHADSALMPGWNDLLQSGGIFGNLYQTGGIFSNSGVMDTIQPNCTYRNEYNSFTGQTTVNQVCDPHIISYYKNSGRSNIYSQPVYYNQPTYYYTQPDIYYTQPEYVYTQPTYTYYPTPITQTSQIDTISYSRSNMWYPCDRSGYCDESLFNTYYRGNDPYYRYYDSNRLCFDGGPNCGGTYDGIDGLVYYPNDDREFINDPYGNYYENIGTY